MVRVGGTDKDRLSESREELVQTNALTERISIYRFGKGQNVCWHLDRHTVKQVI